MTTLPQEFAGRAIITLPAPISGVVNGVTTTVTDADTGEQITSVLDCTVHIRIDGPVVAEMTMLCDEDGRPLKPGLVARLVDGTDEPLTDTFRWLVAEIRTAEA